MKTKINIWYKDNPNNLTAESFFCDHWEFAHEIRVLRIHKNNKIIKLINFDEIIKMESEEIE